MYTIIHTKKSSGGGSRRLLPVAYLYTFSHPSGRGGGLVCGGDWALERSIGKTACGLDGGEEETGREGETDGLTARSRNGSLLESGHYVRGEARHCRSGAVCGGCTDDRIGRTSPGRYSLPMGSRRGIDQQESVGSLSAHSLLTLFSLMREARRGTATSL